MPKRNGILAALGLNVRRQREAKALTQEKLAEKAGLDPTYLSGIERGLHNPGITDHLKYHVHHRVIDAQSVVPRDRESLLRLDRGEGGAAG